MIHYPEDNRDAMREARARLGIPERTDRRSCRLEPQPLTEDMSFWTSQAMGEDIDDRDALGIVPVTWRHLRTARGRQQMQTCALFAVVIAAIAFAVSLTR